MDHKFGKIIGMGMLLCSTGVTQAALIDMGNGLIYDNTLDISWLKNANLATGNNFGVSGIATDGTMSWNVAFDWINALNTNNYLGYSNWRLPTLTPVNGVNFEYTVSYDGSTDRGFNNYSTSNELSNLYYSSLGNLGLCTTNNATGSYPDNCEQTPGGAWGLKNTGPFQNMMSFRYWTDTENNLNTTRAFDMDFTFGQTGTGGKDGNKYVWAVLDGNPLAVPLPTAFWLFSSGLLGLIGVSRRQRNS